MARRSPLAGGTPVPSAPRRAYRNARWRAREQQRAQAAPTVVPVICTYERVLYAKASAVDPCVKFVLRWHRDWSQP